VSLAFDWLIGIPPPPIAYHVRTCKGDTELVTAYDDENYGFIYGFGPKCRLEVNLLIEDYDLKVAVCLKQFCSGNTKGKERGSFSKGLVFS
jgi:hypothetical protein